MLKLVLALGAACCLAGCSSAPATSPNADIAKVSSIKSSFGPEFKTTDVGENAIDPKFFASRKLPEGLTFEPPNCAKIAGAPEMPAGVQGKMAAVVAEGKGDRFVVIAVETSAPLPANEPVKDCKRVTFSGPQLRGGLEVVEAPKIDGAQTEGVHRVLQVYGGGGATQAGELFNYTAQFGVYQVIVTANPLVVPGQQVAPVDTQRARDLLVKAVAAVRS